MTSLQSEISKSSERVDDRKQETGAESTAWSAFERPPRRRTDADAAEQVGQPTTEEAETDAEVDPDGAESEPDAADEPPATPAPEPDAADELPATPAPEPDAADELPATPAPEPDEVPAAQAGRPEDTLALRIPWSAFERPQWLRREPVAEPAPEPDSEPVRSVVQRVLVSPDPDAKAVFVDQSGRRGRAWRGFGWLSGAICSGFAVSIIATMAGANAQAPSMSLPHGAPAATATDEAGDGDPKASPAAVPPVRPTGAPHPSASPTVRPTGHPSGTSGPSASAIPSSSHPAQSPPPHTGHPSGTPKPH